MVNYNHHFILITALCNIAVRCTTQHIHDPLQTEVNIVSRTLKNTIFTCVSNAEAPNRYRLDVRLSVCLSVCHTLAPYQKG